MRKKNKVNKAKKIQSLNEGVYDFYESQSSYEKETTVDKILNYYVDKIRKYGRGSLTKKEIEVFDDARKGRLTLENPEYKRNKLTGDIETDNSGEAIRLDKDVLIPGVPFITSKGKGAKKKETINARCYWDVDNPCKYYYVFIIGRINDENPTGLVIYKTHSKEGDKPLGSFIIPKSDLKNEQPEELWEKINDKYDKGIILDKEMYLKFVEFDDLFHKSRKDFAEKLTTIYEELKKYPRK